jgi:hypothetical protein
MWRSPLLYGTLRLVALLVAVILLAAPPARHPGAEAAAQSPRNLQFFPSDTQLQAVKAEMRALSRALGVECDHCHEVDDFASDTRPDKRIARDMLRMTREINARWFGGQAKATCGGCHRGTLQPRQF